MAYLHANNPSADSGCLRLSNASLRAGKALYQTDARGQVRHVNFQATRMFPGAVTPTTNWFQWVLPEDKAAAIDSYAAAIEKRQPFVIEQHAVAANNNVGRLAVTGRPEMNASGDLVGFVGTLEWIPEHGQLRVLPLRPSMRCAHNRASAYAKPTLGSHIDGVIANHTQHMIDTMAMQGIPIPGGSYSWQDVLSPIPDMCALCATLPKDEQRLIDDAYRRALIASQSNEHTWMDMEPFDPRDSYRELNDILSLDEAALLYLSGSRYFLRAGDQRDVRIVSKTWLAELGLTSAVVNADICRRSIVDRCTDDGVEAFLTDDPDLAMEMQVAGICGYVVTRPWNAAVYAPFRVSSLLEFVRLMTGTEEVSAENEVASDVIAFD